MSTEIINNVFNFYPFTYSIDFDDFDAIANTDPMNNLLLKKNVVKKPANHRSRKSRNPVKALANRTDIKNNYNQHDKTAILIQSNSEEDSSGKTHLFSKVRNRSSTCPLTGFFWLLSHVIYLKLTRVL